MDRVNQLRGGEGGSGDSTLDTSSPPSAAYETANESSSKYFSLSEVDSTFDISPIKDMPLTVTTEDSERTVTDPDELISNLSPISKKSDMLDSYKIGKQIEAANILSGGVDIFDDNDNSYDGNELVIDDNAELDEKSNPELKVAEPEFKDDNMTESTLVESDEIASKDTEVVLQIDGKNVDAIDIGNGIYLYRKEGQEELAAVQIIDDDQQQPSFKFLKVRENAEGNLEVYEEIEIEVPKEVPPQEGKSSDKNTSHVPIKDINKVISESTSNKVAESKTVGSQKLNLTSKSEPVTESNKDMSSENKTEINFSGKMKKINESRKSPVVGSFTPMAYHSTPNKEGIPLTKTMVNQQLHPSRHSDNKKTIEVHTDCSKKLFEYNKKDMSDKEESEIAPDKEISDKAAETKNDTKKDVTNEEANNDHKDVHKQDKDILEPLKQNIDGKDIKNNLKDSISLLPAQDIKIPDKIINTAKETENTDTCLLADIKPEMATNGPKNDVEIIQAVSNTQEKSPSTSNLKEGKETIAKDAQEVTKTLDTRQVLKVSDAVKNEGTSSTSNIEIASFSNKKIEVNIDNLEAVNITDDTVHEEHKNQPIMQREDFNTIKTSDKDVKSNKKSLIENLQIMKNISNVEDKPTPAVKKEVQSQNENMDKYFKEKLDIVDKKTNNKMVQPKDNISTSDVNIEKPCIENSLSLVINKQVPEVPQDHKLETVKDNLPNNTKDNVESPKKDINKETGGGDTIKSTVDPENHSSDKSVTLPLKIEQQVIENKKVDPEIKNANVEKAIQVAKTASVLDKKLQNIDETSTAKTQFPINDKVDQNETKSLFTKENIDKLKQKDTGDKKGQVSNTEMPKPETSKIIPQNTMKDEKVMDKILEVTKKKDIPIIAKVDQKPLNNNHAPVPFGQWTEANRQEYINKFKETKAPVNTSNSKQIKNSNDLNRRDVLKKIDSQRQSSNAAAKAQETLKTTLKNETMFTNKSTMLTQESKIPVKTNVPSELKPQSSVVVKQNKPEASDKLQDEKKDERKQTSSLTEKTVAPVNAEVGQKKDFINAQDIIDITIEDMIHRNLLSKHPEENKPNINKKVDCDTPYDDIEMKMNELHGIPFVERPPHELPSINEGKNLNKSEKEKVTKSTKIPNLLPYTNKSPKKSVKDQLIEIDSEEEIIEHEPITGDIDTNSKITDLNIPLTTSPDKKEPIITENDFDKFARRNSVTYENCITVSLVGKDPDNVKQTVVEKDIPNKYSKGEIVRLDTKSKLPQKHYVGKQSTQCNKVQNMKVSGVTEDPNKHYQSKLQIAYQSALTAKRQLECPITIIEDKPVKVVFIESNTEYIPTQLNVQGQELSPAKKSTPEIDAVTTSTCDSLDSDVLDSTDDTKSPDEAKSKSRHQRKQVFTPVEAPDLELIQPGDLGIEVSPKKKRKTEDSKYEKQTKNLIHKKSYLLGRTTEDKTPNAHDLSKTSKDAPTKNNSFHREAVSAIDSLVKAAELLEHQTDNNMNTSSQTNPDSQQTTPVKRGRGRPRKYPLPEGADKNKIPSPQKKPRLIDAKPTKRDTTTEEEDSSDDEIVKENWTMGKINENIVCPICNKLFRSENVVFKHVKHCTGVSPNRSDSETRSPRRMRLSQESESKSEDMDNDDDKPISIFSKKETSKTRKSKDSDTKDEIIVLDDSIIKVSENKEIEKREESKQEQKQESKKSKTKIPRIYDLVCEFCGKSFRQNSYLISHMLQHKKEEKKIDKGSNGSSKSVFSCEVCKKPFRKLHHLVQHRLIHNNTLPSRILRKISSEQKDTKAKDPEVSKQNDDPSAGFRCEPCDKSFRKLHHLVEHRETHDGINRQKTTTVSQVNAEKPIPTLECDICKKTFRKLHHLVEHKEQHNETASDKSDDRSVNSSLSTKDIIHECSLCYMVFPNEHSLNKHTIICQRKKKQSKQAKSAEESENLAEGVDVKQEEIRSEVIDKPEIPKDNNMEICMDKEESKETPNIPAHKVDDNDVEIIENPPVKIIELKPVDEECTLPKPEVIEIKNTVSKKEEVPEKAKKDISEKNKKFVEKDVKVRDTPKKKTPMKDKVALTVTKRKKTIDIPLPVVQDKKPAVESSDDDEVRYMLNPDFKEDISEDKLFMKVRAKKRNSLQIERPNSKDLVKRRTSLQHPPKIPRLKSKQSETKVASSSKSIIKAPKLDPVPSTDSDDSDVKYSLPQPVATKSKVTQMHAIKEENEMPKRSSQKRKSLSSIAKRKSLGKAVPKRPNIKTSPVKYVRRRRTEVEHRCDCGELFSSAALLSRHTSIAHTPPRIRKRRSPPPDNDTKPSNKTNRKTIDIPKPNSRKSSVKSDSSANKSVTRSSVVSDVKTQGKANASETSVKNSTSKPRRSAAHRGVPVPEKMRKLMQTIKK